MSTDISRRPFDATFHRWPVRLISLANARMHWAKRARIIRQHRMLGRTVRATPLPATVVIRRIGPRKLDDDNLVAACKGIRDGIADRLGVADNDPRVVWRYEQRRGKPREYAVEVEIIHQPSD